MPNMKMINARRFIVGGPVARVIVWMNNPGIANARFTAKPT